ncbi:MAG: DUF736 domain-containing protein [Rhizobiaceae bacterium]|nr:DUF736 domain-containing protein [Rhizobiaceae bacterium]
MTIHTIEALLAGPVDPDLERQIAMKLPLTLRQVDRSDDRAPDYHVDANDQVDIGYGWSQVSRRDRIPYVNLLIKLPTGLQVSGVAWQSPEVKGRWFAQFQQVSEVKLHA